MYEYMYAYVDTLGCKPTEDIKNGKHKVFEENQSLLEGI